MMEPAVDQRTAPLPPAQQSWAEANGEFDRGRVIRFNFTASTGEEVPVAVTMSWFKAWRNLPLTLSQRTAIRTACIQIAKNKVHPCLGRRRINQEPIGSWMASPCPGVTVTWRPHWGDDQVPVMLTLESL